MKNKWGKLLLIVILCVFIGMVIYMTFAYKTVPGADQKVSEAVRVYAQKAGVAQRAPFINTDKGDILLFLFCISGLVAGFYLGYNWRKIISDKGGKG